MTDGKLERKTARRDVIADLVRRDHEPVSYIRWAFKLTDENIRMIVHERQTLGLPRKPSTRVTSPKPPKTRP